MSSLVTVISGSYRKHMEHIGKAATAFKRAGIKVLAPASNNAINPGEEFVILSTDDPNKSPQKLEVDFMRKILRSNFLYVVDIDGYAGKSAATEMAFACLNKIPIVTAEEVKILPTNFSENTKGLLEKSIINVLSIDNISLEQIQLLRQLLEKTSVEELTHEQVEILQVFVKELLKELKSLNK